MFFAKFFADMGAKTLLLECFYYYSCFVPASASRRIETQNIGSFFAYMQPGTFTAGPWKTVCGQKN